MEEEVKIGDIVCRVSSNYVELKNIKLRKHTGTAICILELQKGDKIDEIKVGFDFDFEVYWDEAPDENGKMHQFIDAIFVQKLYRRHSNQSAISNEYIAILEEAILKLNDSFMYRISCSLDDKYEC